MEFFHQKIIGLQLMNTVKYYYFMHDESGGYCQLTELSRLNSASP